MKRIIAWLSVIFALGAVPMLMGPTGGYPSRPTFQTVTVSANGGESIRLSDTAQAADTKNTLIRTGSNGRFLVQTANDASPTTPVSNVISAQRTTTASTIIDIGNATDNPTFNVNAISLTPLSNHFTANFAAACTVAPSAVIGYQVVGNFVTMWVESVSGFPCTSNSTSFTTTATPVPAGIRPTVQVYSITNGCLDNGAAVRCDLQLTPTGDISIGNLAAAGVSPSDSVNWTAAGNKNLGTPIGAYRITYGLGAP
jgi:hypothetical protein